MVRGDGEMRCDGEAINYNHILSREATVVRTAVSCVGVDGDDNGYGEFDTGCCM